MGMVATLEQISNRRLNGFIRVPPQAYRWITEGTMNAAQVLEFTAMVGRHFQNMPPVDKAHLDALAAQLPNESLDERAGDMQHLAEFVRSTVTARSRPKPIRFSLEKDWHVLHYALNHTAEADESPLGACILGGSPIPDLQHYMGFGPIRYLTSDRVREIAAELEKVDPDTLLSRIDPEEAMSRRVYLADTLDDQDGWSYFPQFFAAFRAFYVKAAKHERAMLSWIS